MARKGTGMKSLIIVFTREETGSKIRIRVRNDLAIEWTEARVSHLVELAFGDLLESGWKFEIKVIRKENRQ